VSISRFASLLDGYRYGFVDDPAFREMLAGDLADGQHRNPDKIRGYFMDTFFHLPEELEAEIDEAGFARVATAGLQRPFSAGRDLEQRWEDAEWRERLLDYLRRAEEERSLLGGERAHHDDRPAGFIAGGRACAACEVRA